tara:strand:+ start:780 stop:986 length:207 start_codon:yes stop_codon:yes gene_type:complete
MKQKPIFKITYTVTDRGETWTPQPIETNETNHGAAVKKHLKRWRVALDLSPKYTFKIIAAPCVGYGFV